MKTVKALKLHEDNVHFKKFKCDSCDQAFSQNSELQKHLKTTKIWRFAKSGAVAPSKLKLERQANGCRLIVKWQ